MGMQSRRTFLKTGLGASLLGCSSDRERRPNILVIITDDQRPDAMSCYDKPSTLSFLKTPNQDRLAAEGVRFRNMFVTTSLCSPSRASMMTGKYVHTHGVNQLAAELDPRHRIFPALLKEGGYETGFVGKWHIGAKSDVPNPAFDYWAGVRGQGEYVDPTINIDGSPTQMRGYSETIFADLAQEFIRRDRQKPFFLWLAHKAPHSPCTPPRHLETLFDDIEVPLPATYYETHEDKPPWYVTFHDHDYFHYLLYPKDKYEKYVKNYCRTIVSVDENLGRILKTLDEKGLTDNTAIFYLGDNGHFLGEHQLYSKMLMYEESIRIPLLVRYPGFAPGGTKNDDIILNADLAPTILDIAGVGVPEDMEGRSSRQMIAGNEISDWRRSFLYEYFCSRWGLPDLDGVRTADGWKYVRFPDWEQLYNLNEDPTEVRNLAKLAGYQDKKKQLIAELQRLGGGRHQLRGPSPYKRRTGDIHQPLKSAG
jgi:N-acetylglucosamine-6-sulfatase